MKLKFLAAAAALCATATNCFAVDTPIVLTGGSGFFGATRSGSFSDNFTFTPLVASTLSSVLTSISLGGTKDITFTSVRLATGTNFVTTVATFALTSSAIVEQATLPISPTLAGGVLYAISVVGTVNSATASYSGSVNVVPEPQTYALMLAGLAGVGVLARRRNRSF